MCWTPVKQPGWMYGGNRNPVLGGPPRIGGRRPGAEELTLAILFYSAIAMVVVATHCSHGAHPA